MRLFKAIQHAASIALTLSTLVHPGTAHATTPLSIPPIVTSTNHQNDKLVTAGYLDVVAIYGADPSGNTDSTVAIQKAMNDGINYSMDVYLPTGTYLVSNTLKGVQDCTDTKNYAFNAISRYGMHKAPSLVGPAHGTRPTIMLKDGTFTNSSNPQPLVHFINTTANATKSSCNGQWVDDTIGAFDILFNAVIRDVNFKLGNNPGAIGIQYYSAQFSYMQNVSVDANGGYIGIEGAPATEVWTNIDVNGGQYGVLVNRAACGTSTVVGLTLENQTVAGFSNIGIPSGTKASCGAITIIGFSFQESGIPALSLANPGIHGSTLDMVDGSMTITGGGQPAIDNPAGMAVYMNNVYVKAPSGVKLISNNTTVAPASGATVISPTASGGWDYFQEYAHNDSNTYDTSFGGGLPVNGYTIVNDIKTKNDFNSSSFKANGGAPPSDLVTRNIPGQLPSAMDSDVLWVTDYGADTTGESDSTTAIRNAIVASLGKGDKVFLPRGVYNITGTITLNPNTQLFGVPGNYSLLNGSAWVTKSMFHPFIQSANSQSGMTIISDLEVELPSDDAFVESYCKTLPNCTLFPAGFTYNAMDNTYLSALNWQVGRNSVLNQFFANIQWSQATNQPSAARKIIEVSGGGGGRWYGLQAGATDANNPIFNNDLRALLVTGTTEPLTLYGSNPEHWGGDAFYEFSGASNIRVLGLKTENGTNTIDLIRINNGSSNVLVTGISGDYVAGSFTTHGSTSISLANIGYYGKPQNETNTSPKIIDDTASYIYEDAYALFKLGSFDDSIFDISASSSIATVSPNPAHAGQTITVTSNIGSITSVYPAMVVFWYHDGAGNLIGRTAITGLSFTANQMQSVTGTFTIPSPQAAGVYSISASIYDSTKNTTVSQMPPGVSGSFSVQ